MSSPKVTVLMPVYNGANYLRSAVESILGQSFTDFELLIINDGSTDDSEDIILSYTDPRIRFVNNKENLGLVSTLNKGIDLAGGEYIARMDCDDISMSERLAVQVKFMDTHQDIGVSGSFYNLLVNGKKAIVDFPRSEKEMRCYMVFNCPIAHPSAIIRRSILQKNHLRYRPDFIHSEDFDLWTELSESAGLANIPAILLTYRAHAGQITGNEIFAANRIKSVGAIRTRHLKKMGVIPSDEELFIHNLISDGVKPDNSALLNKAEEWLQKLCLANDHYKKLDKNYFEKTVLERWLRLCFNYYGGVRGLKYFYGSGLNSSVKLPIKTKLQFIHNLYYSWRRSKIK